MKKGKQKDHKEKNANRKANKTLKGNWKQTKTQRKRILDKKQ